MSVQSVQFPVVVTGKLVGQVDTQLPLYKYKPKTHLVQTEAEVQVEQFTLHARH